MDFNSIEIKAFGHLLEPQATRQELIEGVGVLERALAAAEMEKKKIEDAMDSAFRLGRGPHYRNDGRWQLLQLRAERLTALHYAVRHLAVDAKLKDRGLAPFQVTRDGDLRLRQAMDQAEKHATTAAATARVWQITGEGAVDHMYMAEVEERMKEAEKAKAAWQSAVSQQLFNDGFASVQKALGVLVAAARKVIPDFQSGGDRALAFVQFQLAQTDYRAKKEAFGNVSHIWQPAGPSPANCSSATAAPTAASNSTTSASSDTANTAATSASGNTASVDAAASAASDVDDEEDGFEIVGAERDSPRPFGRGRHDEDNITEAMAFDGTVVTRPNYSRSASYERLLAEAYPLAVNGRQLEVGLYATTVQLPTVAVGSRTVVYEVSELQVAQILPLQRLNLLESAFRGLFGFPMSLIRDRLEMDIEELEAEADARSSRFGRTRERPGCVLWIGLLQRAVTTLHIRLLLAFLCHRELKMVKRGFATRSGDREDYAWAEFQTLAEARHVRYRYDGISHWGLTPWDENRVSGPGPKDLHFCYSTHPEYIDRGRQMNSNGFCN